MPDRALTLLALTLGLSILAPSTPLAQGLIAGTCTEGCVRSFAHEAALSEFYILRTRGVDRTNWLHDLSIKNSGSVGDDGLGATALNADSSYLVDTRDFTNPEQTADRFFVFVTAAPDWPTSGGQLFTDSAASVLAGGVADYEAIQSTFIGNSTTLILPETRETYDADLGAGFERFPREVTGGFELAFGIVPEVAPHIAACMRAGLVGDPLDPAAGVILGYNVYRVLDEGGVPPLSVLAAVASWQYFMRLDDDPASTLTTLHDPDGVNYSGDEVLVFRDTPTAPDGTPRTMGSAPDLNEAYWYAIAPVVRGSISGFTTATLNGGLPTDYTLGPLAVDLNLDGSPEFVSPQASLGLPGLGLTNGSLPLLSSPVRAAQKAAGPHDDCDIPQLPTDVPGLLSASTVGATVDGVGTCITTNTSPGVWFTVTGTGTTMTASTCENDSAGSAGFDTKLSVFCGSCASLICIAGNDDLEGCLLASSVSFETQVDAIYRILVHGFALSTGSFSLAITEDGIPVDPSGLPDCTPPFMFTEDCTNGIDDDEDGRLDCLDPDCFDTLACGETVCDLNNDGVIDADCCGNRVDDDENGLADCDDEDCLVDAVDDCDGDGVENGVDCEPADPMLWEPPEDITDLRVAKALVGPGVEVTWLPADRGEHHDVLSGFLPEFWDAHLGIPSGACAPSGEDLQPPYADMRSTPGMRPPDRNWDGLWYVVRAQRTCTGSYGFDSEGVVRPLPAILDCN